MTEPITVLIQTSEPIFVPDGFVVNERLNPTFFVGTGIPACLEVAMQDPRVKSISFAQIVRGKFANYGCPPGAKKAEVKAAKRKLELERGK